MSSSSYLRVPIASVVAPLFNTKVKRSVCCENLQTLEELEQNPKVKAVSYGFYALFAILFGVTYGTSIVTKCM